MSTNAKGLRSAGLTVDATYTPPRRVETRPERPTETRKSMSGSKSVTFEASPFADPNSFFASAIRHRAESTLD